MLGLLAIAGLVYIARRSQWPAGLKAEFYLCAWLAAALSAEVGRAHPTFPRYFVLAVPFLAILATVGLYAVRSRVWEADQPRWAQVADHWASYERLARKIDEVTPRDALLFADEPVYSFTRRVPPPGLELTNSHKV